MSKAHDRGQYDWLIEVTGAALPAVAAAFAAAQLAPVNGWPLQGAVLIGGGAMFAAAFAAMRIVPTDTRHHAMPSFEPPVLRGDVPVDEAVVEEVLLLDQRFDAMDELLLDQRFGAMDELLLDQPMILASFDAATAAVAELLLDDPLPATPPDSRVVQLFADGRMPTAGQLKRRIDRHLADGTPPASSITPNAPNGPSDSADALNEALAALRRSLRQA